ncbi:MAG: hypothetical protein AB7E55_01245 [Pigmentiphaga sp.]
MHDLINNVKVVHAVPSGAYANVAAINAAAVEVDIEDARSVIMFVTAGSIQATKNISITLQGANTSGGAYSTLKDPAGDDAKLTFTEAGQARVEVKDGELRRYLKILASTTDDGTSNLAVVIVAGRYETAGVDYS